MAEENVTCNSDPRTQTFESGGESKGLAKVEKAFLHLNGSLESQHAVELHLLCATCGKKFNRASNLKIHEKLHFKDTICDLCGRVFEHTGKSNPSVRLIQHQKICQKMMEKKLKSKCKNCGLVIVNKAERERHERKCGPQRCEKCGFDFEKYSLLSAHRRYFECKVNDN